MLVGTQSGQFQISNLGFCWEPFDFAPPLPPVGHPLMRSKKIMAGLVHDMTNLEGNPFTFPEVQTLLDGITVGGHKVTDEKQVINTSLAWKLLFKVIEGQTFELSLSMFLELHCQVAAEEALEVGKFRTGNVGISGTSFKPPPPAHLNAIFEKGLSFLKGVDNVHERAFAFFLFGARSQFFWDGNKRTSRLMMAGELLANGFDLANVEAHRKTEFNAKMIQFYETADATQMMDFLKTCVVG